MPEDASTVSETPKYDALTKKEREWVDTYFQMGRNHTAVSRSMGYRDPRKHGWRMSTKVHIREAIAERLAELRIEANDVLYRVDQRARASAEDFLTFDEAERTTRVRAPLAEVIEVARRELALEQRYLRAIPEADEKRHQKQKALIESVERRILRLEVELEEDPEATGWVDGPTETYTVARFDLAAMRDAGKLHLVKSVKEDKDGSFKVELHDAAHADDLLAKHVGITGPKGTEDDPHHHVLRPIEFRVVNRQRGPDSRPVESDGDG